MIDFAQEAPGLTDVNQITKPRWSSATEKSTDATTVGWLRKMGYQVPVFTALMASEILVPQLVEPPHYTNTVHAQLFQVYNGSEDPYTSTLALLAGWNASNYGQEADSIMQRMSPFRNTRSITANVSRTGRMAPVDVSSVYAHNAMDSSTVSPFRKQRQLTGRVNRVGRIAPPSFSFGEDDDE